MNQFNFYIKTILLVILLSSCNDGRKSRNIFIVREVRSEYEFVKQKDLRANLGDVIIIQSEYKNQEADFLMDVNYDSGPDQNKRGIDYAFLNLPENVTVNFRFDPKYDLEIKLTNLDESKTYFTLNKNKTETSVKLNSGDYKFIIENNELYTSGDMILLPVFIQPDREKYDGKELKSDVYRPQDLFILIAGSSCVGCNFSETDSALDSLYLANSDLRDVTFRNTSVTSSTFTNSNIGAFEIDPSGKQLLGKTSLLSASFKYCLMNNVSFYGTRDMSFAKFYKTMFYGSDFSRSSGQFVEFENCSQMGGSRFDSVSITDSDFIGVKLDSSSIRQSNFIRTRFQAVFIRSCNLDSSIFYLAYFQNSFLDYSSLNGTVFCQIEKPIETTYEGITSDESTKCLDELVGKGNN